MNGSEKARGYDPDYIEGFAAIPVNVPVLDPNMQAAKGAAAMMAHARIGLAPVGQDPNCGCTIVMPTFSMTMVEASDVT